MGTFILKYVSVLLYEQNYISSLHKIHFCIVILLYENIIIVNITF